MLREIHILRGTDLIYWRQFGNAIPWETLSPYLFSLINSIDSSPDKYEGIIPNILNYKVSYSIIIKLKLLFVFVTDTTDDEKLIRKQLNRAKEEFQDLFSEKLIKSATDPSVFNLFNPIADLIHKNLRPKISLVGFSGVGKTTITKLIRADDIPKEHNPTMTGDIYTVKIGKLNFNLWDFAGQEQFSFLWPKFIKDSDAVLIITDSTLKNIEKSKSFSELARVNVPRARVCAIANKQDLPDALTPQEVGKIIGINTYGMIAIEPNNRAKMIEIVAETLGIAAQVSPLIRPLLDRDKLVEDAEKALTKGEFTRAIEIFEEIAKYSIELGDSKVANEFLERAKFIESKISSIEKISQQLETGSLNIDEFTPVSDTKKPIEIVTPSKIATSHKKIPVIESVDVSEEKVETFEVKEVPIKVEELPKTEKYKQELLELELELEKVNFTLSGLESNYQNNIISEEDYQKEKFELNKLKQEVLYKITQTKINLIQ
ncbi:MAG: ADP-ribosylation factor-like protein [Candidatus Hodarchaeota archaeon]